MDLEKDLDHVTSALESYGFFKNGKFAFNSKPDTFLFTWFKANRILAT